MTPMVRNRLAIVVCVAVPLAGIDLLVKSVLPTAPFFFHRRSDEWTILSAVVLVFALLLARLPSRLLAASAGLLAAGVLGNLISARLHHGLVPNPLVIVRGGLELAFNLADLFALGGIVLLTVAALRLTVRSRHLLPQSTLAVRLARRVRSLLAPG
jgi:Signal peptidase (SPase) II